MSESIDLVSAAFVAAQAEFKPAAFDSTNPFFRSRYSSFVSVLEASQPILAKHGLAVLRKPSTEQDGNGKLWTVVETVIIHKSGQSLPVGCVRVPLEVEKGRSLVQSWGAEVTYIGRYAWTTPLGIASDEDTDGNDPSEHGNSPTRHPEPKKAPEHPPTPQNAPKADLATPAYRMRALNKLQAAPGQANRGLVESFLRSHGWINNEQQCEDWPLLHVPASAEAMATLTEQLARFEDAMGKGENPGL